MQPEEQFSCGIVIVAAGRGERAGQSAEGPKQYRTIGGRPVIAHTLDTFATWAGTGPIVVVIHPDDKELFASALKRMPTPAALTVVHGGATRQLSVLAGLEAIAAAGAKYVMIHDAVRPFADHALLDRCRQALLSGADAVLPALAVADTLKRADANGVVQETVARSNLYAAQTPQCFTLEAILSAHRAANGDAKADFTDDASIAEWAGIPVVIVEGMVDNIKLTLRRDISMADERLKDSTIPDVRTGNGYDVHQLVEGNGVTLCGVFIPHDRKLSGHSDADVALHALTDALLATCGAGDIGDHFPPSDPQWKGAPSRIFLEHAARIVRERGGVITNADISLIAEAPKVGPHRQQMRENLAAMLGVTIDRCSIKATTNEQLGFIGRNEGIAAIATATVVYTPGRNA
ncbi:MULTISPECIES: bifunctional 2-C-methyl-D-erythritol 4-phosphate cytidylyltransferase/2-C-methyl-D-erythritol 2,4-cyclodiphosphate synthase [unclassified Sinorhizobium]|uniref:bifunctional 2-C-methyl-D-erythritol 4-phosphate cytidylyltransferase/2-C-methyl-D-erythritol 2,4-cyclodiphosphate synthase n=1 Tax=unclassified Sinorhizobium TaxID=2613772 RepID=UPI0024C4021E|nr:MULTISPECIES: bifunctional 2-C-methyl-D-erythritol 4-phosphate cytidylyltransferase/2-C-methyl-D-erythritol 2,4-cyclodiphosphate synthase [unclassified Sinorhizobium]MDK1376691.1 bifunctional 2-C-methyl-D-erythritol 4-phosphate cytidylyltransferase/2-C-methyl-D-erythritol 2,4-cyclodiphosphate synthase [Sinorhizobium sp. 6-70]MDK1481720.1 bifunctional 2-C-methyl-D-erythritol 4-phosphate cytidylyltransferase/2-C-methyl-D-erythritol 2,4-cyclodiphosphate synthase [Sinorhizobium sp. 6-117]